MMINQHADLIDQYTQDWKETDKPWEWWELQGFGENTWAGLAMGHRPGTPKQSTAVNQYLSSSKAAEAKADEPALNEAKAEAGHGLPVEGIPAL